MLYYIQIFIDGLNPLATGMGKHRAVALGQAVPAEPVQVGCWIFALKKWGIPKMAGLIDGKSHKNG